MRSMSVLAVALLLAPATALAAPPAWKVDATKSKLGFHVVAGGQPVDGVFPAFDAVIAFDPADLAHSSIKTTIDMTRAQSGNTTRDAMLPLPAWFDAKQFPKAHFDATTITSKGGKKYEAVGTLSLKGISKRVTLPFTLTISGNTAHALGETTIKRQDFKVGDGKDYDPPAAALNVKVTVDITATRRP